MNDLIILLGAAAVGYFLFYDKDESVDEEMKVDDDGNVYEIVPDEEIYYGTVDEYENDIPLEVTSTWDKMNRVVNKIYRAQGQLIIKNVSGKDVVLEYPDLQLGNLIPQKGANNYFDKMVSSTGAAISYLTIVSSTGTNASSNAPKVISLAPGEERVIGIQFSINGNQNGAILLDNNTQYYQFPFSVVMEYSIGESAGKTTICSIVKAVIQLASNFKYE